ncbi:MAG: TIGR01620 family protein, partial [Alphaproteobacteria bacterium HGW-Alphaproteobacteria-2]
MSSKDRQRPMLFEVGEGEAPADPATAPPPADPVAVLPAARLAVLGARQPSRLWRLFLAALGGLVGLAVSLATWDFVTGLIESRPLLGTLAAGLGAAVLATGLLL